MLKKRLKYDFKSISKYALPLLLVLGIAVIVGSVSGYITTATARDAAEGAVGIFDSLGTMGAGMINMLCYLALISAGVGITVIIFVDFYRATASDEAYLTFTLPVPAKHILFSKLLTSLAWSVIVSAAMLVGMFLMIFFTFLGMGPEVKLALESIWELIENSLYLPGPVNLYYALTAIHSIVASVTSQLLIFFAIFFGSVIAKKRKVVASIGCYFGFTFIYSMFNSIISMIVESIALSVNVTTSGAVVASCISTGIMILISAGAGLFFFYYTVHLMENKLNLA